MTKAELLERMNAKQPPPEPKHLELVKLFPGEITQWGIWHQERDLPTYSKGTIAVLGDAAHASCPYLSTGAGIGYEDAAICAELLKTVIRKDLDVQQRKAAIGAALQIHSNVRRERSQYMVHSSLEAGKTLMGLRPTPSACAEEFAVRNYEVWNYDIAKDVERALRLFSETYEGLKT